MDKAWDRAVVVFVERIDSLAGRLPVLVGHHDHGTPQRLVGILRVEKAGVVRGDSRRQRPAMTVYGEALIVREVDDSFQAGEISDGIAKLPAPIVPLGVCRQRIEALTK
jgi:hypothetical protein